jgi:uncharacterized membrane protein YqjE
VDKPHPISIAALVSGLAADMRSLFEQEIRLARHEIQYELRKFVLGLFQAGIGFLLSLMATTSILLTLVHWLHTYTPLTLWACYGIVGLLSAVGSGVLLYNTTKLGASLRLWPFRAIHSLKENARWIKEHVLSTRT